MADTETLRKPVSSGEKILTPVQSLEQFRDIFKNTIQYQWISRTLMDPGVIAAVYNLFTKYSSNMPHEYRPSFMLPDFDGKDYLDIYSTGEYDIPDFTEKHMQGKITFSAGNNPADEDYGRIYPRYYFEMTFRADRYGNFFMTDSEMDKSVRERLSAENYLLSHHGKMPRDTKDRYEKFRWTKVENTGQVIDRLNEITHNSGLS